MQPRPIRETTAPCVPNFTFSMLIRRLDGGRGSYDAAAVRSSPLQPNGAQSAWGPKVFHVEHFETSGPFELVSLIAEEECSTWNILLRATWRQRYGWNGGSTLWLRR